MTENRKRRKRGPHRSRDFWRRTIAAWLHSSQCQEEYCEMLGVSLSTFHRWRRRLVAEEPGFLEQAHESDFGPVTATDCEKNQAHESDFVSVMVTGYAEEPQRDLEIVLADELRVRVPVGFDASTLERLLSTLAEVR